MGVIRRPDLGEEIVELVEDKWYPMDTAPRDGSQIIVAFPNEDGTQNMSTVRYDRGYWVMVMIPSGGVVVEVEPTHWTWPPSPPTAYVESSEKHHGNFGRAN